jgi:predicted transcriptional regulator
MRLMERDREILKFINAVGWCNAIQLEKRFGMRWWIVYRVMKRLMRAGLVLHKKVSFELHGIYYLTSQGASYTDLPPVERISKGIYDHQQVLVDVVLKLQEKHPEAIWVSERHLIQQKFQYGVGKSGHVSDGILIFPDEKKISIEVELSLKSKKRLRDIFNAYAGTLAYKEVWYFCEDNVMRGIQALAGKKSFIKIHSLREFLHESL